MIGTKPHSARSPCMNPTEDTPRRGAPLNGCARLTRAATEGGRGEGDPQLSSACPRRAAGARGGRTKQRGTPLDRAQDTEGDPKPQQRAQTVRGQGRVGDRPRTPAKRRPSPEEGGDNPERQRALPVHSMPKREGGGTP